jgi:hypothetical protein
VGLVRTEQGGYVARRGHDDTGRFYARVQGMNGRYGIYFAPWACGREGGLWLGGFTDPDEATEATDLYVAGYLDAARE